MLRRRPGTARLVIAAAGFAAAPAPAEAALERVTVRQGPLVLRPYQVRFTDSSTRRVRAPRMDGFVVRMHARVVDARARPMPVRRVMLHHIVYKNAGRFRGDRRDGTCGGKSESFYGTGEENATLRFPPGYGYRIRRRDRWLTGWMLMNHRNRRDRAYIEYTALIDTSRRLRPVKPYWLRVTGCRSARDPIFNVPGGGAPGSSYSKSADWEVPVSGRLVAANSHLHGGAITTRLRQPACGDRVLLESRPRWGLPSHPYYKVLPVLHEPGPIGTDWVQTDEGIPVARGELLRVSATYDDELLHTRVMGIMHVYVAPGPAGGASAPRCAPLPGDVRTFRPRGPGVDVAPKVTVPLTGLDANGRARTILRPPGPTRRFTGSRAATVLARERSFSLRNLSVPLGGLVRWRSLDHGFHDVTVASGPVGFASYWLRRGERFGHRFRKPGTYRLFCSLHPIDMTQTIEVRPGP
jgi:plastocyanin